MGFLAIYGQLFNLRRLPTCLLMGTLPAHWLGGTVTIPVPLQFYRASAFWSSLPNHPSATVGPDEAAFGGVT